jgi:hypothetical protein
VDKTTSEPTLDEKIELQLDSITSQVKTHSLYPDELEMEVIKTTNIDLNKILDEYVTGTVSVKNKNSINGSIEFIHLNDETKAKLLTKFKTDNISFRVLALRFKNRITDNQLQFEYLNVLFDQNGNYTLLADKTDLIDISSKAVPIAAVYIDDFIKPILEEMNKGTIDVDLKKDNNITYFSKEEFDNFPPSGRKDFMEHNLEWIEKTHSDDKEKIKLDEYLSSTEKAEYLIDIENEYIKRIENVRRDGECRFK